MRLKIVAALVAAVAGSFLVAPQAQGRGDATVECTNAELVASYHGGDAAMSHVYGRIVLTNTSDHTCSIRGYGGLSYVGGGDGTQIGAAGDAHHEQRCGRSWSPRGSRCAAGWSRPRAGPYGRVACRHAHVDGFRVYLPDETHSQFVKHPTVGCRNRHIHLLAHRAYRA